MEKNFRETFTSCPCCGSEERFFEQLANELKERGIARPDWSFHLDLKRGVVLDPAKEASIPIGSELPGFEFATDICIKCGCIYATELLRVDAKITLAQAPRLPLNRADRRRLGRDGELPFHSS